MMMNFVLLMLCGMSWAQEITQLGVPLYADPRRAAELSCRFDMRRQQLHSVKWYHDSDEIFRYSPAQKVEIRLFNVSGVAVQSGRCERDACSVRVMPAPVFAQAAYTCEVSSEGPMFHIAKETKHMTVVAMPEKDPVISNAPAVVKPGEVYELNCTSDYSLPPAEISWYIDDVPKSDSRDRGGLSTTVSGGLRSSWRAVRVQTPAAAAAGGGALRLRCEAALPLTPRVLRDVAATLTVFANTHHSRFMANNESHQHQYSVALVAVLCCVQILTRRG